MSVRKFRLLLWKNYRLRRYHWILTLAEIIFPIMLAIYITTNIIANHDHNSGLIADAALVGVTYTVAYNRSTLLSTAKGSTLAYTPTNNFTDELMRKAQNYIDSITDNNAHVPNDGKLNLKKFVDETALETFVANFSDSHQGRVIGIVFYNILPNASEIQMPDILNYKLRDCDVWHTQQLYPLHQKAGPSFHDPYHEHGLAAVQMIVNEEFIRMKTGETPWSDDQPVFQPFPYPEYEASDIPRDVIPYIVQSCVILSILAFSVPFINDVIEEKDNGFKDMMKLTGLEDGIIWISWFINGFFVPFISFTVFVMILKIPFDGEGTESVRFVTFPILWIMITLYTMANIPFCFMFCVIFHRGPIASIAYVVSSVAITVGVYYLNTTNSGFWAVISCLFPLGAFIKGFFTLWFFEELGIVSTLSSLTLRDYNTSSVSLLFVFIMMIFDIVLYSLLTLYIYAINPGKFGTSKSPLFIFQRFFPQLVKNMTETFQKTAPQVNSKFVQSPPTGLAVTIQLKDLYKHYGSIHAVDGVNLNIHEGEITILLGHFGAGKTTTMSLITGLASPTSGSVYYKDMDVHENLLTFRRSLGMCPQENRLLPYLSAMDHLLLFGMLKGISKQESTEEANEYLTLMDMQSRKSFWPEQLSVGQKRKLCLSISLMGKADTLVLDEPTSGMDLQSRRKIWNLLSGMRGSRTIILATHHLFEADALGGRIAILQHGRIVCHGQLNFLKRAYGTGYNLTIIKENEDSGGITQTIQNTVQGVTKEQETADKVVYKLPSTDQAKFSALFKNLESGKSRYGITHIDVAYTSLENVFLKAAGVSINDSKASKVATVGEAARDSQYQTLVTGLPLRIQQAKALFKKKYLYTKRRYISLIIQIILSSLILAFVLRVLKSFYYVAESPLDLSLRSYPNAIVMLQNSNKTNTTFFNTYADYVRESGSYVVETKNNDIVEELLNFGRENILTYRRNLIAAIELSNVTAKVLYNLWEQHSLPIAITMYSNSLLKRHIPNKSVQIQTQNHPVMRTQDSCIISPQTKTHFYAIWVVMVIALAFFTIDVTIYFAEFTNMESSNGFLHIQMMSNVSSVLYWMVVILFDYSFYILIIVARIMLFKMIDDDLNFLEYGGPLGTFMLVMLAFGISGLLFFYVISLLFTYRYKEGFYVTLFILNVISAFVGSLYHKYALTSLEKSSTNDESSVKYVILLLPPLNFYVLFCKIMDLWEQKSRCSFCLASMRPACEAELEKFVLFEYPSHENPYGLLLGLKFLLIDAVVYAVLLILISTGFANYCFNIFKNLIFRGKISNDSKGDGDVQQEYERVQEIKANESSLRQVSLLADGLYKKYIRWFRPITAISNVTFAVEPGKCFGLLGINDSGKTTILKILTAEIFPTRGTAYIEGVKLSFRRMQYLSMAGYCAQTDCFIAELTGREMLILIALLRGVSKNDAKFTVNKWISVLDLEEYQNLQSGNYSFGNKRKLCAALSLIGNPRVVFLDEPTNGVDPVSRRKLYDVIGQSKEAGQTVVITSHSVEECEALCDRLTIMSGGIMKCIGSTQHLKKQYAQGFSALIKVKDDANLERERNELRKDMMNVFTPRFCLLEEEQFNFLHYQIKDTSLPWSALFDRMEGIQRRNQAIVEEYVLTDTTLEDVFISFANPENKSYK